MESWGTAACARKPGLSYEAVPQDDVSVEYAVGRLALFKPTLPVILSFFSKNLKMKKARSFIPQDDKPTPFDSPSEEGVKNAVGRLIVLYENVI